MKKENQVWVWLNNQKITLVDNLKAIISLHRKNEKIDEVNLEYVIKKLNNLNFDIYSCRKTADLIKKNGYEISEIKPYDLIKLIENKTIVIANLDKPLMEFKGECKTLREYIPNYNELIDRTIGGVNTRDSHRFSMIYEAISQVVDGKLIEIYIDPNDYKNNNFGSFNEEYVNSLAYKSSLHLKYSFDSLIKKLNITQRDKEEIYSNKPISKTDLKGG